MFNGVGWGEVVVLLMIGLFVFGPERLPRVARDAGRMLRQVRQMATGMREDLRSELGPELADLDLRTLHPKTFVRKHLFEDDDPLPPYLSKRTSFDRMLFDDDSDVLPGSRDLARPRLSYDDSGLPVMPPSLTKPPALTRPPSLTKAFPPADQGRKGETGTAAAAGKAPAEPPVTPFDIDAT